MSWMKQMNSSRPGRKTMLTSTSMALPSARRCLV
jgi:hypothetical protein